MCFNSAADYIDDLRQYTFEFAVEVMEVAEKSRDEWIDIILYLDSIEMGENACGKTHDDWPEQTDSIDLLKKVAIDAVRRLGRDNKWTLTTD